MNLLEELEILLETRQPYANGNAEKCYPFVAELIQQLRAAQQNARLTPLTPSELGVYMAGGDYALREKREQKARR